ncbi:MAG: hypothetical protein HY202_08395 [Nitrospirae bacterium]|nr:hypothetical protein [Nitrospirota bacterium]MBI3606026.1 hypothetical protein [Nitrospirota bacterium]
MTTHTADQMTGTEVLSVCAKCKVPLAHTIVAMDKAKIKKVQCKTCESQHRFVSPEPKKQTPRTKVKIEHIWEELMKSLSSKKKISYTLSGQYKGNDVIDHPVFGIGIVNQIVSREKFRVVFKEGEKLLASGRPI